MNALLFDFNLVPRCLVSEVLGCGLVKSLASALRLVSLTPSLRGREQMCNCYMKTDAKMVRQNSREGSAKAAADLVVIGDVNEVKRLEIAHSTYHGCVCQPRIVNNHIIKMSILTKNPTLGNNAHLDNCKCYINIAASSKFNHCSPL